MPEYIEREAVMTDIKNLSVFLGGDNVFNKTAKESVLDIINFQPTADVAEVKHAEWKVETYKTSDAKFIKCSNCNSVIDSNFTHIDENEFDYCPYCGAKMDGKENGNAKLS